MSSKKCPQCGLPNFADAETCKRCDTNLKSVWMKEYKVLTQKDLFLAETFDPQKLEERLNAYAAERWRVISIASSKVFAFVGAREELVIILERDKTGLGAR
ncbi:MAG: DUF4177 domain-containing protein [Pyrinomonadaceae bacterium]